MKNQIRSKCLRLGAVCLFALTTSVVVASDSSAIRFSLENTGVDTNAAGAVTMAFSPKSSQVMVKASNLTPGQNYTLFVGVIPELTAAADSKGRWNATFRTPPKSSGALLDFDPRGLVMALNDGNTNVLQALVSRTGEPSGSRVSEKTEISDDSAKALLTFQTQPKGRRIFTIKLSGVSGSNWVLYVNGLPVGNVSVSKGRGSATFDSSPSSSKSQLLTFDPRGLVVDIAQSTNLIFTGSCEARIKNVNLASPSLQLASIPSTGLDSDATAKAKLRVDGKARRKFSVEVEDVPVGAYGFFVNDVLQGNINVVTYPGGTHGEIEFSSRDDSGDELPLTFDPTNSTFSIQQGVSVYFQGAIAFSTTGGSNEPPAELDEILASTGLDGDASGHARYRIRDDGRRDFNVEIEDVPVGSYPLFVGGVQRGSISVVSVAGKVQGEIEFSNPVESGKSLLNFDPRGQLIEVKSAVDTFFSHLFGGSGTGGSSNSVFVVPMDLSLPLFNTGIATGATAKAEFKRKDNGDRNFEVEIEDAPLGSYNLIVGGVSRATINVVSDGFGGTRGQVEFDSDSPQNGELLLDFDPLGQLIELIHNGESYFAREFPTAN